MTNIKNTILEKILIQKRKDIEEDKNRESLDFLKSKIKDSTPVISFKNALSSEFGFIAEIKKKSPSASSMLAESVEDAAEAYQNSSLVKAVSVLTDYHFFGMKMADFAKYRTKIHKPILRKDFIIDDYQIYQARAYGADAILLMAQIHEKQSDIDRLYNLATDLGMSVLFECHNEDDFNNIPNGASIIGVNCRKFMSRTIGAISLRYSVSRIINKDLTTETELFSSLMSRIPKSAIKVAESGVNKPEDAVSIRDQGYNSILIGSALLKYAGGVEKALSNFEEALYEKVISHPIPSTQHLQHC